MVLAVFLSVKHLPLEVLDGNKVIFRNLAKVIMTILLPLSIVQIFNENRSEFGINFQRFSNSFKLSLMAYAICGPAGMAFVIIGSLGWGFQEWPGALLLSAVYLLVFYLVPKVTKGLPTHDAVHVPNKRIIPYVLMAFVTVLVGYFLGDYVPFLPNILYFIFIVGLGEELLFRGYVQSSFNMFFGKPYQIGNVKIGPGLFLAAMLFGLMHALVVVPPLWPWALFTFVMGLTLGYIREKDGSIQSAILLHAMMDMPLVFVN